MPMYSIANDGKQCSVKLKGDLIAAHVPELQEALTVLAERMPEFALDGPVRWKPEQFGIWGPEHLPLRWSVA